MLNPLSSIQAVALAGAIGLAAGGGAYVKGRVDGWAEREEAQKVTDLGALAQRVTAFEDQLRENAAQGATLEEIQGLLQAETEGLSDEIADMFVCPTDPVRRRVLNAGADAANRALDRAAGRPVDDPPPAPADTPGR